MRRHVFSWMTFLALACSACGEASLTIDCPANASSPYCAALLADGDGDGVPDGIDNCPAIANADQADGNGDGVGDACTAAIIPDDPDPVPAPDPEPAQDSDGDGVPDDIDNCPAIANADQADGNGDGVGDACTAVIVPDDPDPIPDPDPEPAQDSDGDGVPDSTDGCPNDPNKRDAGACGCGVADTDSDGDGVPDCRDNCPNKANADQADYNSDGVGDACTVQNGTVQYPFIISPPSDHHVFTDARNTSNATSDVFDTYGSDTTDESGKEFIYAFKLSKPTYFAAEVQAPEPDGVDIDVHLLSSLTPTLIARNNLAVTATLEAGVYYLSLDSYKGKHGEYVLDVTFRPVSAPASDTFNSYILKAIDYIEANWARRGYKSAAFTHDLPYGGKGTVTASNAPYTMCVAAATEVLLTAMDIYASETGDNTVFDFLPVSSWKSLNVANLRAHIWCNHEINTYGSADALRHFGMGQTVPFSKLTPGSFINLNRTSGTGHAVIFLSFIDINGNDLPTYSSSVAGFRYYSSQGNATSGGFDYRCAIFSEHGSPTLGNDCANIKRDTGVLNYQNNQKYLNTGIAYAPSKWHRTSWSDTGKVLRKGPAPWAGMESVFDEEYFDGVTIDDDVE